MNGIERLANVALQANMRKRMEVAIENAAEVCILNLGVPETIKLLEAQLRFLREFE